MTFILADLVDFQFEAKKELGTVYNVLIEAQGTTMRGTLCSLSSALGRRRFYIFCSNVCYTVKATEIDQYVKC